MAIYDINYTRKVVELLPIEKRTVKHIKWLRALIGQVQFLRDKWLGDYRTGSSAPAWSAGTYAKGATVKYKGVVYESLVDSNTDTPPSSNWRVYLPSFIGVEQRRWFDDHKLTLEYALNKRFGATFRQPIDGNSNIYIGKNAATQVGFLVGETEDYSSRVDESGNGKTVGLGQVFVNINNFTIYIKTDLYATINEQEVRQFTDPYVTAGTHYNIQTY